MKCCSGVSQSNHRAHKSESWSPSRELSGVATATAVQRIPVCRAVCTRVCTSVCVVTHAVVGRTSGGVRRSHYRDGMGWRAGAGVWGAGVDAGGRMDGWGGPQEGSVTTGRMVDGHDPPPRREGCPQTLLRPFIGPFS